MPLPDSASHATIIDAFGGPAAFSSALGIDPGHGRAMYARNSISAAYWRRTALAAAARKRAAITFEQIALIYARAAEKRLADNERVASK